MNTAIKSKLSKKNLEMEKLEQSKKSHLRMLTSSAAKLKLKYGVSEENHPISDSGAKNVRMYETHFPGFCYLRNGQYRKTSTSKSNNLIPDPIQCSEKIKEILFTNQELDVYKTMCLHLLGTHIENKYHIQRKDGRLCSYVKAQSMGNTPHTLQPHRVGVQSNEPPSKYDKMLPKYILDVKIINTGASTPSCRISDTESESEEETKIKRKVQVPVFINHEIRIIITSVLEALDTVKSSKLNELVELASSPEELRNLLANEDIQDYIIELASDPLVTKPTSYNYVMTHLMFDKIPEKGTLETVAQVLEVYDDSELNFSLQRIRKSILLKHLELLQTNVLLQKKSGLQGESSLTKNYSKIYNPSHASLKYLVEANSAMKQELQESRNTIHEVTKPYSETINSMSDIESLNIINKKRKSSREISKSVDVSSEKTFTEDEGSIYNESYTPSESLRTIDTIKYDLRKISNSERILLGLKIASLKSTPMHQFEGKKKIDVAAIINPIIHSQGSESDSKTFLENHSLTLSQTERKAKRCASKSSSIQSANLANLSRGLLANLRLEISESENKKRLKQFMATIS